ncbi:glucose-1-phosphate thymidylyltransferase, partial [Candidatus Micrarchaeota archaeon]|nr:glucose-1-phosphate thymidylyltransferase [Candidatus Micrarchaeota archaeon]
NHEGGITLAVKKVKNPHIYGVVELEGSRIIGFQEKPEHPKTDLANLSVYIFDPDVFGKLENLKTSERGEYEITDLFVGAKAVEVEGFWMDIAYPWDLFRANEHIIENLESKLGKIGGSNIKGKVIMEEGAEIIDSFIEGNIFVGKNSKIGPNAYIRGTTSIGENCSIGGGTTVKNCILGNNLNAKHLAYLGDSIIGDDVNFGSGTQLANYRFDSKPVSVYTEKGWVNTGRKKFGCVIGSGTKFGVLSCVMPGKLIGNDCWISSGVIVNKNIFQKTRVFIRQEHVLMKGE